jgi:plastocyanin
MKRLAYLLIPLSVVVLLGFVPTAGAQSQEGQGVVVPVSIQDGYFDPDNLTVPSGTTILWTNEGNLPHSVTSDVGLFDSGLLYPGERFQVTLYGQGTTTYHCSPNMMGTVTLV